MEGRQTAKDRTKAKSAEQRRVLKEKDLQTAVIVRL